MFNIWFQQGDDLFILVSHEDHYKTNKLRNVNGMWWGRRDVSNQKWKTDDEERKKRLFCRKRVC
jgi:hypothetical protein